jgi:HK97 family phage portal protein
MAGIFGAIARPRAEITSLSMEQWARLQNGGAEARSGVFVSPDTALRYSTVLICVRVLAESVASLPCILYKKRADGGKDRATEHPLYKVLHDQANAWNTAFEYVEGTMSNLALRGNGYAYVERNRQGQTIGLVPLHPDGVTITQAFDWSPKYEATMPDNTKAKLSTKDMHHIRGPLPKGYVGRSMIDLQREAIGLGMAAEQFSAHLYANGVTPSGVLSHGKTIGPEGVKTLAQQFSDKYSGLSNGGKPLVLEEGMTWTPISITPKDAEFILSRKFQRSEIAGIFRVPPHLVGDLERATFSNIEHQSLEFIIHNIRPWLVRWEQSINRDLLTEQDRANGYFAEFLMDAFLRGDTKSRYEAYASAIQNKWMSANEARIKENMNPREGGDVFENPAIQVSEPAANENAPTTANAA